MIIYLSLLVAIAGLLLFALATTAKPSEIGKIMFGVGLLAFLLLWLCLQSGTLILEMK
jgi:Na+/phosphate symporter